MKLYSKTYLFVLPLVILPLLLLGWIAYYQLATTTKKIVLDEMRSSANLIKSQYDLHIKTSISNIELFSNHSTVLQYAVENDPELRYSLMQLPLLNQFSRYQKSFPGYFEFRFILPDGFEDTRWTRTKLKNKDEYENKNLTFKNMASHENDIYFSIFKNKDNNQPSLWISKRILIRDRAYDSISTKKKLRGYFVITSNFDFLTKIINDIKIGEKGYFIITTGNNELLVSPTNILNKNKNNTTFKKTNYGSVSWEDIKNSTDKIIKSVINKSNYIVSSKK